MVQLQKDNFWSNTHLNKYPNPESNRINQNLHAFIDESLPRGRSIDPNRWKVYWKLKWWRMIIALVYRFSWNLQYKRTEPVYKSCWHVRNTRVESLEIKTNTKVGSFCLSSKLIDIYYVAKAYSNNVYRIYNYITYKLFLFELLRKFDYQKNLENKENMIGSSKSIRKILLSSLIIRNIIYSCYSCAKHEK